MQDLASDLVAERRRNPNPNAKDVLNAMLDGVDRETGEKMSDENIAHNLITFLVRLTWNATTSLVLSCLDRWSRDH